MYRVMDSSLFSVTRNSLNAGKLFRFVNEIFLVVGINQLKLLTMWALLFFKILRQSKRWSSFFLKCILYLVCNSDCYTKLLIEGH
jgi:hypothetical protein